ncbi:MAG TPA: glycoside hydrolase family 2 TIM barrel-domain containing protein [Fimbriimonas sp.]
MERQSWTNLNGNWEFAFDDMEVGLKQGWCDGRELPLRIVVPFAYQTELSGIHDTAIHEVVWYARSLEYQPEWRGSDVLLHFGAVDYSCQIWVNGQLVGGNKGGHVPFSIDIAPYLIDGDNRLVLRVEDRQEKTQPRGKQAWNGKPEGIDYTCTTGIWQTVWLEAVPQVRIDSLRLKPLVDLEALKVRMVLHAPAGHWTIEIDVLDGDEVVSSVREETYSAVAEVFPRVPQPRLWSPEDPHLYDLHIRLIQNGELVDEVRSYVGMRSVELKNGEFLLNGQPVYMKMILDQGYWRGGLITAPTDEDLRRDVELTKAMGFNGSRKHQKVEDPRWLYWCDKLGLLVWGEMANARAWSPEAEELFLSEWQRVVQRDYNHPCIVTWVPLNESWGVPQLAKGSARQYAFVERAVHATRLLDSTRPVVDNDGWDHTDVTDIVTVHDYTPTGFEIKFRYAGTCKGGPLPKQSWWDGGKTFVDGSGYRGQPVMLTEVGGFLIRPAWMPREQWDVLYDTYGSVSDGEDLLQKYRDVMGAIASLPFVSGFCYTQLTDVEQEINGLLTYDREPKVPLSEIAKINASLRLRESDAPAEVVV